MMASSYRDLRVWRDAIEVAVEIYQTTRSFPRYEIYGITSQLRRAAVSISSNIGEGKGRSSDKEFIHFFTTHEARFWNSRLSSPSLVSLDISTQREQRNSCPTQIVLEKV
jgi:23S rRNA-intervening sequence protein